MLCELLFISSARQAGKNPVAPIMSSVATLGLETPVRVDVAICMWVAYGLVCIFALQILVVSGLSIRWHFFGGKAMADAINDRLSTIAGEGRPTPSGKTMSSFEVENPGDIALR